MIILILFFILIICFFLFAAYTNEDKGMTILLSIIAGMFIMSVLLTCNEMVDKHTETQYEVKF